MGKTIGIDLGTTYSAVAYVDPATGVPRILPNKEGNKLTPSAIQFLDDEIIVGSEAKDAFSAGESNCVTTFKREMGSDEPYCFIDGKAYSSEELSTILLRYLKEGAEEALRDTVSEAVITVPAYFFSKEREATVRAAEKAGIKVKRIIDEPNAAALAYGMNHWRENANILVYDLGGGTFDVSLVHMGKNGEMSTISTQGNHKLGGRDWDGRLQGILLDLFEEEVQTSIRDDKEIKRIISGISEGVKKKLSVATTATVTELLPGYGSVTVSVTRKLFDERTRDLIDRTGALCDAILKDLGITARDITDVLLVGGSTRMPQVTEYLENKFGKKPISHVNPDEAVALGAAIQSTKKNEDYMDIAVLEVDGKKKADRTGLDLSNKFTAKDERKMDLCALSINETDAHAMGVIAWDDDKKEYYNEVIIPENHKRPVRAAKRFSFFTSPNSNNELVVYVLQGGSRNPLECEVTHKYVVSGIKHELGGDRYGITMKIQYSYDVNGIVHVQARKESDTFDLPIRIDRAPTDVSEIIEDLTSKQNDNSDSSHSSVLGLQMLGTGTQNVAHKYKPITFSNVSWEKYDNISDHPSGEQFNEPTIHVIANEKNIEFHGYNISAMDEGVKYQIRGKDNFEIECDINTSTISPHPGGYMVISIGVLSAQLSEIGGKVILDGTEISSVGSTFHIRMALTGGGQYTVDIDGRTVGSKFVKSPGIIDVIFGFVHGPHYCHLLSHAYVSNIVMIQSSDQHEDDSPAAETWDD